MEDHITDFMDKKLGNSMKMTSTKIVDNDNVVGLINTIHDNSQNMELCGMLKSSELQCKHKVVDSIRRKRTFVAIWIKSLMTLQLLCIVLMMLSTNIELLLVSQSKELVT